MHKKVQSLLITGVLSANMFGSTVAVFADDELKKENGIKTEEAAKPNVENIEWQKTDASNYTKLWKYKVEDEQIVLTEYIGAKANKIGAKENNVEIPRKINGKKVVLESLNTATFPNVERIKVADSKDGNDQIKLKQTDLKEAFDKNKNIKSVDLRGIDVSDVTNLYRFLADTTNLEEVNLSGWNVSNVTDLCGLLINTTNLKTVNLSGWDASNVTDMSSLLYQASSLKTLDISGWKTSDKLKYTYYMFYGCSSLTNIDLTSLNMDNVTNTRSMFQNCSSLKEIKGTEEWTLRSVENINLMFSGTKLNFIDLSNVRLPDNKTLDDNNMKGMFSYTDDSKEKKLLVATEEKRLIDYNKYDEDGRVPYNLIFNTDEGEFNNGLKSETIKDIIIMPKTVKLLRTPTKTGYTFDGWGEVNNGILTAKWKKEVKPGGGSTGTQGGGSTGTQGGGSTVNPGGGSTVNPGGGSTVNPGGGSTVNPGGGSTENPGGGSTVNPGGGSTENPGGGSTENPGVKPENPGVSPENPGVKPETPGGSPESPEVKPETPGGSPENPEVKPEVPGGGTNNDNTPVLDGTDKDNIMIHPLECLPSVYELIDENMVSITQRGDGTEKNPVILQVKDSIYKVDLTHFITKFDTLNSNVSTIKRNDKYTEYSITVDNKNATSSIKKTAPAINDKITFVKLRINNTKIDLIKEANRYSRRRNYEVKIPIIVKFSDVKDNFWGRSYIEEFASMGVVDGYPNNEFKPNNSITRAEFVRIINNAFGYTKAAKNVKFNDVEKNSWYYNDIAIGLEQGYINGRSETTFSPNDNITREEVAMILTNIMNNKDNDFNRLNNFNDGNKTSDWAKSAMAGAIKAGYLIGDDQKNLSPTKNMTRAEAIASLSRVRPVK